MSEDAFARFQRLSFRDAPLGFSLDYSRIGFDEGDFVALGQRMGVALQQMDALEAGAEANRDEQRMVGHYWLRAPELAPDPAIRAAISETQAAVIDLAARVHSGAIAPEKAKRFRHAVVVGIGGSSLGPQLVDDALRSDAPPIAVHFADNTDPDGFDRLVAARGGGLGGARGARVV